MWRWWLLVGTQGSPLVAQTSRNRGENRGREWDGRLAWVPAGRTVGYRRRWTVGGYCRGYLGISRRWWPAAQRTDRERERDVAERGMREENRAMPVNWEACIYIKLLRDVISLFARHLTALTANLFPFPIIHISAKVHLIKFGKNVLDNLSEFYY